MITKKNNINIKLVNIYKSKFYYKYAEQIRKCYNFSVKEDLTNSKKIATKTEHLNWLLKEKKKINSRIFIAEDLNKKFIGYIRSEKIRKYNLISISLKKNYRKKNIGTIILKNFINNFKNKNLFFLAIVKKKNFHSVNFFKKSNFKIINNITMIKKNTLKKNFYLKLTKD